MDSIKQNTKIIKSLIAAALRLANETLEFHTNTSTAAKILWKSDEDKFTLVKLIFPVEKQGYGLHIVRRRFGNSKDESFFLECEFQGKLNMHPIVCRLDSLPIYLQIQIALLLNEKFLK